ncbi:peptide ABC transporter substrate-binding protein [Herpetosiphon sp.]|uniref:Extracellular solute-binding protein family 5 n=1 Tax=Herpetosiphon aurantiacus (strain ATCC 23779 / DSM 785 / 114-95) TaxID=316274 RepID=A9B401_HERA2|nr:peptide ABC transporter substrate-binding protein [Herpetosiphon sp.]ABX06137.1 extracellular solute-binding protein family 5 [Herpetosiphon aurantiacus DSM 785]
MLRSKRQLMSFALMLVLVVPILAACGGETTPTTAPATTAPATATTDTSSAATAEPTAAEATVEPTVAEATAEPSTGTTPDMDKTIIIGMTQSPDTLFGIESQSSATTQVLSAIQPACFTTLSYEYQPVCFTKLPSFEDGDAVTQTVSVDSAYAGNIVIDDELITDTASLTEAIELEQVVVTWTLIDGMTWEDGTPITAADFVFAAELYQDPGIKNASRFVLDRTEKYEAKDEKTLVWYAAPGYTDATYFLNTFGPEPKHVLEGEDPATIGGSDYASKPLAYGPYKIAENTPQESTKLVANETYWKKGFPLVGNVTFKYLTSEDQVLQQLESGEIDVVGSIGLTLANAPKLDELEAAGVLKGQYVPATVWEHMDFGVERNDGQPSVFADVKLRQAVAYAVNRKQIIDNVLFGKTVVMNTFLPADHWAYPPNGEGLEAYEYDVEKAKALLAEAGWVAGADGILEKDGTKLTIQFYTTENNQTREAVAQLIQEDLKAVGIDVTLNFVPATDVLFKNGSEGILSGRRFDLGLYAWVSGPEPSTALYLCEQVPTEENSFGGQNNTGWCNPDYDKPALASQSETDRAKRIPLVIEAQKVFNAELPTFPLYQRVNVGAYNVKVSGLELNPTSQVDFWNIETWDVTE